VDVFEKLCARKTKLSTELKHLEKAKAKAVCMGYIRPNPSGSQLNANSKQSDREPNAPSSFAECAKRTPPMLARTLQMFKQQNYPP